MSMLLSVLNTVEPPGDEMGVLNQFRQHALHHTADNAILGGLLFVGAIESALGLRGCRVHASVFLSWCRGRNDPLAC